MLCCPILVYCDDEGTKTTEENSKQIADPVNVKEQQSSIKEDEKKSEVDSNTHSVDKTITSGEKTGNRVLNLDGQESYLCIADSQSLRSCKNAITIETWFKASSLHTEHGIVNTIIRKNIDANLENFFLRIRNFDGSPVMQFSIGYDVEVLSARHDLKTGTWYHIAGTYDGSNLTFFLNGVIINSEKASGPPYIDQSDLIIGKGDPEFSSGEYFHGELDEIRIWNVARSQKEIQATMNSALVGKEKDLGNYWNSKGLVAYWNFDDGTAKDLSGQGNNGLLQGNAQIIESSRPASQDIQSEKLISWWKFENDVNDSAGENHGTIKGNPTYTAGKFGQAINLDGDDYVDCGNPDSLNFGTGDWTISVWIKTTQSGMEPENRGTVIANGGDEAGGIRYTLTVNEEYLNTVVLTTDTDLSKIQAIGKTAVNDGKWHHVVGIRSRNQLYVYVDGIMDGSNYLSGEYDLSGTSQHNAYIGVITDNRDNSLFKYFVGLIDELCIFKCALDAKSVNDLFSGKNPKAVAQQAKVLTERKIKAVVGAGQNIEGDWELTAEQFHQKATLEIRKEPENTLSATIIVYNTDGAGASANILLENVTFENGKLHFERMSDQGTFDGAINEDGSKIEGQFRQGENMMVVVLKRIDTSKVPQTSQEQIQEKISGSSNITTTLILILVLIAIVGIILFFFIKASIR
jgi:hypothetical protein